MKFIPNQIEEGIIYISIEFATAIHKCVCGCENDVVTPLSPFDWELTFNGDSVSLYPSIGNWNFPCKSHYWIIKNSIKYAAKWTDEEIAKSREKDIKSINSYFKNRNKKKD